MIEQFTRTTFADRIGETFRLHADLETIELRLVEATEATLTFGERPSPPAGRSQFSIVFLGPREPILPQRIYRFEHDVLGAFDLFIVPIGPNDAGMQYEAVFG